MCPSCETNTALSSFSLCNGWGHLGRSSWSWNLPQNVTSFLSGVALCEDVEVLIIFCASEQGEGVGGVFYSLWEL